MICYKDPELQRNHWCTYLVIESWVKPEPEVTRCGALDMQVCVPKSWDNERVTSFAEDHNPCGTQAGWQIRRKGDPALLGAPERGQCSNKSDHVHVTLDA